jgi:outer membrane immunogenic protein
MIHNRFNALPPSGVLIMRKAAVSLAAVLTLIATQSMAADLAAKARPPAPMPSAPPITWTGFYIGGNIGYAWGKDSKNTTGIELLTGSAIDSGSATLHPNGGFSGLQSGYNWQFAPTWLIGYESDFQYGRIKGSASCLVACGFSPTFGFINNVSFNVTDRLNWFGTVRGRFGYVAGPALLYVTGGLAYGQVEREGNLVGNNVIPGFGGFSGSFDNTTTKVGWTLGGGLEAKLAGWFPSWMGSWNGWSGKVEYLYIDLGHFTDTFNENYAITFPGAVRTVTGNMRENIFRIGLNYQFH